MTKGLEGSLPGLLWTCADLLINACPYVLEKWGLLPRLTEAFTMALLFVLDFYLMPLGYKHPSVMP